MTLVDGRTLVDGKTLVVGLVVGFTVVVGFVVVVVIEFVGVGLLLFLVQPTKAIARSTTTSITMIIFFMLLPPLFYFLHNKRKIFRLNFPRGPSFFCVKFSKKLNKKSLHCWRPGSFIW
jgi:hypothetical protein